MIYANLKKSSFFKQLVCRRFTISSTQTCAAVRASIEARTAAHVCGCKGKIFCLYCQDVVPLRPEVTEKIGIIK